MTRSADRRDPGTDLPRWQRLAPGVTIVVLVLLAYNNSFPGLFVQDDLQIVLYNPLLEKFDLAQILRSDYWGAGQDSGLFRPMTILSLALNRMLFGAAPWGYHLVNVLLHAAVAGAGYRVLVAWGQPRRRAWLAAALFSVHPLHSEVVNVVVGRSELLAALFLLLALLAATAVGRRAKLLSAGAFLLALLSKEHAVVLLLLLPAFDLWRARRFQVWRERMGLYALLAVVLVLWLLWRQWGIDHHGALPFIAFAENNPLGYLPTGSRILTALDLQYHYLVKLFWPYPLQVSYYGIDFHGPLTSLWSFAGLLVVGGAILLLLLIAAGLRRRSDAAFFALLYLLAFSVTANLLLPVGVAFAERLAYFPSFWFCAGIATLAPLAGSGARRTKFVAVGLLTGFFTLLLVLCWVRNRDFQDSLTLWRTEVRRGGHDAFALMNLAVTLAIAERTEEAEEVYRRIAALEEPSAAALRSYTVFLLTQGRLQEALVPGRSALQLTMEHRDEVGEGLALVMLGDIALQLQDYHLALDYLRRPAVRTQDPHGYSLYLQGRALAGLGRPKEARAPLEAAAPVLKSPEAWVMLGRVCLALGDKHCAEAALLQGIRLAPDNPVYREELRRLSGKSGGG